MNSKLPTAASPAFDWFTYRNFCGRAADLLRTLRADLYRLDEQHGFGAAVGTPPFRYAGWRADCSECWKARD